MSLLIKIATIFFALGCVYIITVIFIWARLMRILNRRDVEK